MTKTASRTKFLIVPGDGALGFWQAIEQVFPSTRHQRCWVHKTANVLNKVAGPHPVLTGQVA